MVPPTSNLKVPLSSTLLKKSTTLHFYETNIYTNIVYGVIVIIAHLFFMRLHYSI